MNIRLYKGFLLVMMASDDIAVWCIKQNDEDEWGELKDLLNFKNEDDAINYINKTVKLLNS